MSGLAWLKIVGRTIREASGRLTRSWGYSQAVSISVEPLAEQEGAATS
jgi:hypothetical protein